MDFSTKQHALTSGLVEFQDWPSPKFFVYNHKPNIDKPLFLNPKDVKNLIELLPKWQEMLKETQTFVDSNFEHELPTPATVVQLEKSKIQLMIQTYNSKAYLWLKLFYLSYSGQWLPGKGGVMISYEDDAFELKTFVNKCLA